MPFDQLPVYSIRLTVPDRKSLDQELDRAVDDAVLAALEHQGRGILVTRHSPDSFTVELSSEVPFGIILERDLRGELS
jgi:hypothetical protein